MNPLLTLDLALVPRDGLFCKDARGWYTYAEGRGHTLPWPLPTTIRGALRNACGRAFEESHCDTLEPRRWEAITREVRLEFTLPLRRRLEESWHPSHRMWPCPADAVYQASSEKGPSIAPARPRPLSASIGLLGASRGEEDEAREALWYAPPEGGTGKRLRAPRFWTDEPFVRWLVTWPPSGGPLEERTTLEPTLRGELHVRIDPQSQSAVEGGLFGFGIQETLALSRAPGRTSFALEWAIGLKATVPQDFRGVEREPFTVGGRGRLSRAEKIPHNLFDMPEDLRKAFNAGPRGLRLIVVTPALFERGWLPDGFRVDSLVPGGPPCFVGRLPGISDEVVLRAACLERPTSAAGWDMVAGRPRPTLRLVAPGAVYFVQKFPASDGSHAAFTADEAAALWLAALGTQLEDGLGRVVPGLWEPEVGSEASPRKDNRRKS